jgi:hypothetical protein
MAAEQLLDGSVREVGNPLAGVLTVCVRHRPGRSRRGFLPLTPNAKQGPEVEPRPRLNPGAQRHIHMRFEAELHDEIAGQFLRFDLAAFLAPEAQQSEPL